jgi:GxxExxY protein
MTEDELSNISIGAAIEVHRELGGPGLLESVYEEAMVEELTRRGLVVERQAWVPIFYKGKQLASPLRLDLKVNGLVLVDNKAVVEWNPIFESQMLTYLRLTKLKLGLVINFVKNMSKTASTALSTASDMNPEIQSHKITLICRAQASRNPLRLRFFAPLR